MIEWSKEDIFDVKYSSPFRQVIRMMIRMLQNSSSYNIKDRQGRTIVKSKWRKQMWIAKLDYILLHVLQLSKPCQSLPSTINTSFPLHLAFFFGSSIDGVAAWQASFVNPDSKILTNFVRVTKLV